MSYLISVGTYLVIVDCCTGAVMFQLPGILSATSCLSQSQINQSIRAFNRRFAVTVLLEYRNFSCKHEKMQLLSFKPDFLAVVSQVLLA